MEKVFVQIKNGFTLAEVLITLVIIGVIAAMTIPTLINKTNKQEIVSSLKKVHSTLAQVTTQIIAEEGSANNWSTSTEAIYDKYKSKLSLSKDCGNNTGCFHSEFKFKNGTSQNNFDADWRYKFILSDGTLVSMGTIAGDFNSGCTVVNHGSNNYCQIILVDVNGGKGPNIVSKDIFAFVLKEDGLYPAGCDSNACSGYGWGCTCKVIREGAINY